MPWQVMMEDDGTVTLPPALIAELGWTPETRLCWQDTAAGIALAPVSHDDDPGEP